MLTCKQSCKSLYDRRCRNDLTSAGMTVDMTSLKLFLIDLRSFFFFMQKNTEKPAYLCSLFMIFTDHMQLHCQGNSKWSLPKLDSKIERSCSDL